MERREFMRFSGIAIAAGLSDRLIPGYRSVVHGALSETGEARAEVLAEDEAFWRKIRQAYVTTTDLVDFDNANTAPTPAPVFDAYVQRGRKLRHAPAESFGKMWNNETDVARKALAALLGSAPSRLAFTLNATVALNTVLHGFPLERGDEILVTNHEYPDMVETVLQRQRRDGIVMKVVKIPLPNESSLDLVRRVTDAIGPRTRLLLISHVSAWSGEILPVKAVTRAARAKGVAVLVDAAQSVGVLDVSFDDIGCDFLATSLHKWVAAPMGTGALIMRQEHFGRVLPLHPPSWDTSKYPTDLYEWTGTFNMAAYAAVNDALDFQRTIGLERKRARVRYLGEYWQSRLASTPGVRILTPREAERRFGVASFMIEGVDPAALVKHLRSKGILVQNKAGRHSPFANAIRVSPGVYATTEELDQFVRERTWSCWRSSTRPAHRSRPAHRGTACS
ncbi:MAG TPA: aminotransferase class V-fold PLP-dependent enzyme [Gemmatimonadaceae bacterium]|nr:aminotransferase class V-fold PLP-dependent enzyme [Gemmatimonadaceae bacterium]